MEGKRKERLNQAERILKKTEKTKGVRRVRSERKTKKKVKRLYNKKKKQEIKKIKGFDTTRSTERQNFYYTKTRRRYFFNSPR